MKAKINKQLLATTFLFGAFVLSLATIGNSSAINLKADGSAFAIEFESNKNKIGTEAYQESSFHSGVGTTLTELGNSVEFTYSQFANPTGVWQTINSGGYFFNNDAITGMESISLVKSLQNEIIDIFWSDTILFSEVQHELFDSTSLLNIFCDFNGEAPNYIKVCAVNNVTLVSGSIEFSCVSGPVEAGKFQFGSYPQSMVSESSLISTLNGEAGILPSSSDSQGWTDYGYYINGAVESFMWYIDVINGADQYRGVYFTSYRPFTTVTDSTNTYQDDNGFITSTVYWFKYEPITWRILEINADDALLMCNIAIDSQQYYHSTSNRTIGETTIYPSNYEHSYIRSWLNDNFYNTAFNVEEKAIIQTTNVDNSALSADTRDTTYECPNTNDKIFLINYLSFTTEGIEYGLNTYDSRMLEPSDYSISQGIYESPQGFSTWMQRSPRNTNVRVVYFNGDKNGENQVNNTSIGVVPFLRVSR